MTPAPPAIRLRTQARDPAQERPPLGIAAWSTDASAIAVLLEGSLADLGQAAIVAGQIPPARTLAPSTPVLVLGTAARRSALWRRLMKPRAVKLERAPRCAALLALGYVDIGAAFDPTTKADIVWGYAPSPEPDASDTAARVS
jgi:hypothetical protein